ncbi:cell envelope integrity TolA C-terminal domain-containing protein [Klebsiella pneumoniae]|uniref:cell envelope integrity TolA C-terminal domain-containing protein n=1 Tax=Klebsiella pneumoniae TaxID=573 RepID=UPI002B400368|nr:cell envelope integrity TolA C-terminal domain-containing protein [Klebsiella pneumoniae]
MSPGAFKNSRICSTNTECHCCRNVRTDAYKGKTCSIRIYLQPDGSVNSATAKEGDAKLCKAAIFSDYTSENTRRTR